MSPRINLPENFGRYRVLRQIGAGGMGAVFLAQDRQLGRQVALKVPYFASDERPEVIERFYREARVAAGIQHSNICPVYDVGQEAGFHFISMPYIEGQPLSRLVSGPWPAARAIELMRRIATAVGHLHARGFIHRDLKPANVLVRPGDDPVLMDFGLARSVDSSQRLTDVGQALGTPAYMSPEQVSVDTNLLGPPTDVYALGVMLFEMLAGQLPFKGPPVAIYAQILHSKTPLLSEFLRGADPALEAICLKAMSRDPGKRYATAADLAQDLETWLQRVAVLAPTSKPRTNLLPTPTAPQVPIMLPVPEVEEVPSDRINCPGCGRALKKPSGVETIRLKCPYCRARLKVPPAPLLSDVPTRGNSDTVSDPAPAPRAGWSPMLLVLGIVLLLSAGTTGLLWFLKLLPWQRPGGRYVNSLNMEFVLIRKGTFTMGSTSGEPGHREDESRREEKISTDFYLGRTEVTVGQFRRFVQVTSYRTEAEEKGNGWGWDGNRFIQNEEFNWKNVGWEQRDDHPVVNVSYKDAQEFCRWLSEKEGRKYSLPSEIQWEYACRAGTKGPFFTGNDLLGVLQAGNFRDRKLERVNPSDPAGFVDSDDGFEFTAPVGQKKASAWGLLDMHGNVREWCVEVWTPPTLGKGKGEAAEHRVVRGGSFNDHPREGRSAARWGLAVGQCDCFTGFRVVLEIKR